jgi:hypothetical protein
VTRWVAPVGAQLAFLVDWLEPILSRPGLTAVPVDELCIELGEADAVSAFEPFDALVGPVRAAPEGIVADVIPLEAFDAIVPGAQPHVVFARRLEATAAKPPSPGRQTGSPAAILGAAEPLEFVASEAVLVEAVIEQK